MTNGIPIMTARLIILFHKDQSCFNSARSTESNGETFSNGACSGTNIFANYCQKCDF